MSERDSVAASTEDLQVKYLLAVLEYLDTRLQHAIRCWQSAGKDPADRFRGLRIYDEEALTLSHRTPGFNSGSAAALTPDELLNYENSLQAALNKIDAIERLADEEGIVLRLKDLQNTFNLCDFEWWAMIVCLAPSLDLRYERIYGYLQDDITRVQPSVDLILTLLLTEGLSRLDYLWYFNPAETLCQYRLLLPVNENKVTNNVLRQSFQAAPQVVSWLFGTYIPQTDRIRLAGSALEYGDDITGGSPAVVEGIPSMDVLVNIQPIVSLIGEDSIRREIAARQIAQIIEKPLLILSLEAGSVTDTDLDDLASAARDACMLDALLYIENIDAVITSEGTMIPRAFELIALVDDVVVTGGRKPYRLDEDVNGSDYPLMRIVFPKLTSTQREALWNALLDSVADDSNKQTIAQLSGQFNLTTGQIVGAASSAMARALQDGRRLNNQDLFEAARFHSNHQLSTLADKIIPRYTWDDLILPETPISMLHEMVGMIKSRPLVLEEWGLGKKLTSSLGVSALFTGPPGTGKTLAAQIIANELGIDLYRIDLSTVVSKYVGETEKNLERIFNDAQISNAILFFDEADTIFGKRSEVKDAHDRYANIEVGYLLQRMEAYDGVAILATNLRANLDEAFTRRLQFIINFPFPEEEYRLKIWEVLMPPGLPKGNDVDLPLLAKRFKLAGGSIRNCIVTAAFLAAEDYDSQNSKTSVHMKHLMHGVKREFQKMGKLVQEREFLLQN